MWQKKKKQTSFSLLAFSLVARIELMESEQAQVWSGNKLSTSLHHFEQCLFVCFHFDTICCFFISVWILAWCTAKNAIKFNEFKTYKWHAKGNFWPAYINATKTILFILSWLFNAFIFKASIHGERSMWFGWCNCTNFVHSWVSFSAHFRFNFLRCFSCRLTLLTLPIIVFLLA